MLALLACAGVMAHVPRAALYCVGQGDVSDAVVLREAFVRRGWRVDQLSVTNLSGGALDSRLDRETANIIFISAKSTLNRARLMPQLDGLDWAALLRHLNADRRIGLILDTDYSNLLYGLLPKNVSAIVMEGNWRDVSLSRSVVRVVHNGGDMRVGALSYVLARELPFSNSLADLAYRVNKTKDSASMAAIWSETPRVRLLGADLPLDAG